MVDGDLGVQPPEMLHHPFGDDLISWCLLNEDDGFQGQTHIMAYATASADRPAIGRETAIGLLPDEATIAVDDAAVFDMTGP